MKKKSPIFLIVFIVLIAFSFVTNGFYKLDNAEKAVIERFGELIKVVDKPGLSFKIPYIDKVYIVNTNKVESIQYGYRPSSAPTPTSEPSYINKDDESIVLTKGSYIVNIGAIIQYRITDPAAYIYNVDDQLGTARLAFESVLRRNMQNRDLESALIYKESIALDILPDLSRKLNSYGLGITITDVKFTDVLLPEDVQLAYDDVNIAENEKTEYKSKADKYTNEMLPNARAD
ncbi:MAG: protease modulator HflK, partial [Acidaminobacteraceae bacterium]